jgi:hypothetical protein
MDPPDLDRPAESAGITPRVPVHWSQYKQKLARYSEVGEVHSSDAGLLARRWKFDDEGGPSGGAV